MKAYLKSHPNNLIGYFGQPDNHDHSNPKRIVSQRASIYNTIVLNLFKEPDYLVNHKNQFGEINCKYIENGYKNDENELTNNKQKFLDMVLNLSDKQHAEMMTKATRTIHFGTDLF